MRKKSLLKKIIGGLLIFGISPLSTFAAETTVGVNITGVPSYDVKVTLTADVEVDLPKDVVSGLDIAMKVLKPIDDISFCILSSKDVVRHPLVQKIVNAYEKYEEKQQQRKEHRVRNIRRMKR